MKPGSDLTKSNKKGKVSTLLRPSRFSKRQLYLLTAVFAIFGAVIIYSTFAATAPDAQKPRASTWFNSGYGVWYQNPPSIKDPSVDGTQLAYPTSLNSGGGPDKNGTWYQGYGFWYQSDNGIFACARYTTSQKASAGVSIDGCAAALFPPAPPSAPAPSQPVTYTRAPDGQKPSNNKWFKSDYGFFYQTPNNSSNVNQNGVQLAYSTAVNSTGAGPDQNGTWYQGYGFWYQSDNGNFSCARVTTSQKASAGISMSGCTASVVPPSTPRSTPVNPPAPASVQPSTVKKWYQVYGIYYQTPDNTPNVNQTGIVQAFPTANNPPNTPPIGPATWYQGYGFFYESPNGNINCATFTTDKGASAGVVAAPAGSCGSFPSAPSQPSPGSCSTSIESRKPTKNGKWTQVKVFDTYAWFQSPNGDYKNCAATIAWATPCNPHADGSVAPAALEWTAALGGAFYFQSFPDPNDINSAGWSTTPSKQTTCGAPTPAPTTLLYARTPNSETKWCPGYGFYFQPKNNDCRSFSADNNYASVIAVAFPTGNNTCPYSCRPAGPWMTSGYGVAYSTNSSSVQSKSTNIADALWTTAPPQGVNVPGLPSAVVGSVLVWPEAQSVMVSRCFVNGHTGIDMWGGPGTPILAAASGTVSFAGPSGGYGNNYVEITADNGPRTGYGHMSSMSVSAGQHVSQGQQIGTEGSQGDATGSHLHFNTFDGGGNPINPIQAGLLTVPPGVGFENATGCY